MYAYSLKCDSCGIRGDEHSSDDPWLIPAGWYAMHIKRLGYTEVDVHFCPACWESKMCKQAFAKVPWRRR